MNKLEEITTLDKLNKAFLDCKKCCPWKTSIQLYESKLLINNLKLQQELRSGTYKQSGTNNFTLCERGKIRYIRSPQVKDRIVQKVLNQYVLVPELRKYLIYDNGASLKDRGTIFNRKRHLIHLQKFLKQYGKDGYILQIDIRKYFDNIDHAILIKMVENKIPHKELYPLIEYIINNSSDGDKGLNLGSETPQICAILYLGYIDNFCKIVKGIKYYGRYMDDIYIFHHDKEYLKSLLEEIRTELKTLKLEINDRKTHIVKLSHGYTFLQTRYIITDDLKVIRKMTRQKVTRERKKLKTYKRMYENNRLDIESIINAYKSWRQSCLKEYKCYHTILSMDRRLKGITKKEKKE